MAQLQNPFLRGMLASQQAGQQQTMGNLQAIGLLSQLQDRAETRPLQRALLEAQVGQAQQDAALMRRFLESRGMVGGAPAGQPAPLAFGAGGVSLPGGGQGNVMTGQTAPGASQPSGVIPQDLQFALLHPRLRPLAQAELEQRKPIATREGGGVFVQGQGWLVPPQPKTEPGIRIDPNTGMASPVSGYGQAVASIKGLETRAVEGARAETDIVTVPDGRGGTIQMPRSEYLQRLRGVSAPEPQALPMPPGIQNAPVAPVGPLAREGSLRGAIGNVPPETPTARDVTQINAELANPNLAPAARKVLEDEKAKITGGGLGYTPPESQRAGSRKRQEGLVERELDFPQAQQRVNSQIADIDRLIKISDEAMNAPAISRSVGLVGAFPSIPGQPAANVDALIGSLKAQVSGMKLQAMRDASKTGGAVGNVTEKEWPRLESMIVALDKRMSPELFREKLSELVLEMNKMKANISGAFEQEYGQFMQRRSSDPANDPLNMRGARR